MKSLEHNAISNSDSMIMLYFGYKLVSDMSDEESYSKLKSLYFKNKIKMTFQTRCEYLKRLMNFCSFQKTGKTDFYLNEFHYLNKEWILECVNAKSADAFWIMSFRNTVNNFIQLGRVKEIKDYIKNYTRYLDPELKQDCINFALANLEYFNGNYHTCLEMIARNNFKIPMMIRDIKSLSSKHVMIPHFMI